MTIVIIAVFSFLAVVQIILYLLIRKKKKQITIIEEKIKASLKWSKSVRNLQHDLNNHLTAISQYIRNNENNKALDYIKSISADLPEIGLYTETNNPVMNAVLDLKRIICKKENISLKCYLQENINLQDDVTFVTVFGNLIDNAIEAEKKESEKEIRLLIENRGSFLHIKVQNRISETVLTNGKFSETSKSDKENHGIGISNIMAALHRNKGEISFYEADGWLIIDVLISEHKGYHFKFK